MIIVCTSVICLYGTGIVCGISEINRYARIILTYYTYVRTVDGEAGKAMRTPKMSRTEGVFFVTVRAYCSFEIWSDWLGVQGCSDCWVRVLGLVFFSSRTRCVSNHLLENLVGNLRFWSQSCCFYIREKQKQKREL